MRTPAMIFDFGNVIAFFDYAKAASKLGAHLGLSGDELLDRLRPLGFAQLHQDFERGQLSALEFTTQVSALISLAITHDEFAAAWNDIFTANESIIPVIEQLKAQGYRLILGSNTNDLQAVHFRKQFASTLAHFDHLVMSHEVKRLKPHRDFYLACAEAAGLPPSDCIFIDDLAENVEGARSAGLQGILYESTESLIGKMRKLGVVVEPFLPV